MIGRGALQRREDAERRWLIGPGRIALPRDDRADGLGSEIDDEEPVLRLHQAADSPAKTLRLAGVEVAPKDGVLHWPPAAPNHPLSANVSETQGV